MSKHREEKRRFGRKSADSDAQPAPKASPAAPPPVSVPAAPPAPKRAAQPVPTPRQSEPVARRSTQQAPTPAGRQAARPAPTKPPKQPKQSRQAKPTPKPATQPAARPTAWPATAATYGAPSRSSRRVIVLVALVVAGFFLAWLAWVTWFHSTPSVSSSLLSYETSGDHVAVAIVDVNLEPGVTADCVVQALAEDHTIVGERHFTPVDGTNRVQIDTDRAATTVQSIGCTTLGQQRPR